MPSGSDTDQTANIKLLDRFYGTFLAVGITFLVVGVPFIFFRKAVSAAACLILIGLVAIAWRMSRKGQPQKSLKFFATGMWLILVGLIFGGLPPITTATMLAIAVMLSVVVSIRAGVIYSGTFMLAWLIHIVLGMLDIAPPPYFVGKPLVLWFIGALAIWLVLLPIPTLIRKMRMALSLQRATLEAASDGILVISNKRRVVTYNAQFASLWRISAELLAASDDKALMEFVLDQLQDPQQFINKVNELYGQPEASSADTLQFKDGRVFERYSRPQRMDGRVTGRVWTFRDVTKRKVAERARLESEALKTSVLTHAAYAIIATDPQGIITVFNPRAEALLGYRADELIGTQTPALFHDAAEVAAHAGLLSQEAGGIVAPGFDVFVMRTRDTRLPDENEWTYICKDGRRVPVLLSVTALADSDGGVTGYLGVATDITERKQAAEKLAESQQRMELALAGADLGLLDWDIASGRFVQNERFLEMLGFAKDEFQIDAQAYDWLIHPADRAQVRKALAAHFKGETPSYEAEQRMRHKDDHWVWILARGKVVERGDDGRALRMVGTVLDISERKHNEAALKAREARLANLIGSLQELVLVVDTEGKVTEYHLPASFGFPVDAEAALGHYFAESLPQPLSDFIAEAMVGIFSDAQTRTHEFQLRINDQEHFFHVTMSQLSGSGKYASGFLALVRDVSERKRAEQEQRIAAIAFESQEGMVITDANGVILRSNKAFSEITGYAAGEVVGQRTSMLSSGRHGKEFYESMWQTIATNGSWQGEIWNRRKNGEIYPQWLTITAVKRDDGTVTHYVGTQVDITERKEAEIEIERMAYHDSLTQLANRRLLLDRLQHAMACSARSGREGALLFLDLDNFKTLNDTLGHDMGDLLLQQVARRLVSCVREDDTVARLGGDEFVVIFEGLSDNRLEAATQAELAGRKILAALNKTYMLGEHEYRSTPSIGGTLFFGHQKTVDEILKQADLAMYRAKAAGRNALHFLEPAQDH
ncbi:PAS domain S-box protein [Sulfuritalea hydrogenivorans]|uniref:PAS/PAC sensor-containing diguanylate cyclase/phosphodiesterase n=1 Tax=Sulfuritalea hydrogenivorans sk43H TaxID=1223802 RepID=W0SL05_9PROT|nr:PAS domain S-box protein [Sulfuritalea hydrogenivorans]BAO30463.1 PAS/PAC sensor-containing diguanylate cyclase/phosphodiesterase [Sulfuritalea hydrogenivorans sk43H]